ncbi:hypothetical protein K474DRAFT_958284 [Panus rudis PR-1116 ss-1]|nr:hypothetical protein K474DRAFT_958284 [Panus rudis PR-1116 ss-1]
MRLTVPDYANDNMSRSSTPGSIYSTTSDSTAVSQSSYTNPLLINPMDVQAMQGVPQMTSGGSSGQGTIQPQKLMIHPSLLNAAPAPAPNEVAQAPKEAHHPSQIQQPMIVPVRNGSGPGVYLQVPVNNLTQGTDTVMATHAIVGADGRTSYVQLPLAMPGPVAPPPPPAMRYTPSNPNLKLDGAPRIRVQQACEKCRRRKVKCSGDRPTCVRCTKKGVYCEWAPERSMKGPDRGRMMQRSQTSLHYAPAEPDYTTYQDLPYLGATYSCPGSVAMSATNSQEGNTAVQYVVMHQNSVPQSMTTYTSGPQSQPSTPQRSVPRRGHSVIDLLNPMPLPPRMAMIMNDPNEGYFPSPTYMQTTNSFLGGPNDHHNNRSPAAMPLHVGGQSGYITTPPGMSTIPVIVLPGGSQYPTPVHTPPTWSAEPPAISPPASRVSSSTTDLTTSSTTLLPSGNGNGNGSELDVSESRSSIGSHFGVGHSGPELDYVMDTGMCEREGKKNGWDEESEGSFRTVSDPSGFQCESETHQRYVLRCISELTVKVDIEPHPSQPLTVEPLLRLSRINVFSRPFRHARRYDSRLARPLRKSPRIRSVSGESPPREPISIL